MSLQPLDVASINTRWSVWGFVFCMPTCLSISVFRSPVALWLTPPSFYPPLLLFLAPSLPVSYTPCCSHAPPIVAFWARQGSCLSSPAAQALLPSDQPTQPASPRPREAYGRLHTACRRRPILYEGRPMTPNCAKHSNFKIQAPVPEATSSPASTAPRTERSNVPAAESEAETSSSNSNISGTSGLHKSRLSKRRRQMHDDRANGILSLTRISYCQSN